MSAYVQSKAHIDALLRLAVEGPSGVAVRPDTAWRFYFYHEGQAHHVTHENVEEWGARLTAENVRSVQHRYPDDGMDMLPGPVDNGWITDAMLDRYHYPAYGTGPIRIGSGPRQLSAVEGLKAVDGYEYQSCEHPAWSSSIAHAFCMALRKRLISRLDGYDEADTWSITEAVPA